MTVNYYKCNSRTKYEEKENMRKLEVEERSRKKI